MKRYGMVAWCLACMYHYVYQCDRQNAKKRARGKRTPAMKVTQTNKESETDSSTNTKTDTKSNSNFILTLYMFMYSIHTIQDVRKTVTTHICINISNIMLHTLICVRALISKHIKT